MSGRSRLPTGRAVRRRTAVRAARACVVRIVAAATVVVGCSSGGRAQPAETATPPGHADPTWFTDATGTVRPVATRDDWAIRRAAIIDGVERVMGPLPDRRRPESGHIVPLGTEVLEEVSLPGDILRRKIRYATEADDRVTAHLFLPSGTAPRPAVLCLHQTIRIGKDEPAGLGGSANLHYAHELAQRGFVTLAPDYPSFGDHAYDFAAHPQWHSGSLKAVWDNMRAVDLLQGLPGVDGTRIGCIGHSLGGHNAIFTAVFDDRIRAVVSSCGFTRFHAYKGGDLRGWTFARYMPRIAADWGADPDRVPFDFPELIASIAPRAFFTSAPVGDDNFDCQGVRETIAAARTIYRLFDADDRLRAVHPDCGHDFPPAAREDAYRFLEEQLTTVDAGPGR